MKLLFNGKIYADVFNDEVYQAILIDDGQDGVARIKELWGEDDIPTYLELENVEKLDLNGKTVLPGFIDSHLHLQYYAETLDSISCVGLSKEDCVKAVAEKVALVEPGEWILGHGWRQATWKDGFGTLQDLDKVAPENPVFMTDASYHTAWVNTKALEIAGITLETPDPEDGVIGKTDEGQFSGILYEFAYQLVSQKIPQATEDELIALYDIAQAELWKFGITGVHDFDGQTGFAALQKMRDDGILQLRVNKNFRYESFDDVIAQGFKSGGGDAWIHHGNVKIFMDGALGPKTAAMMAPYEGSEDDFGILMYEEDELFEIMKKCVDYGLAMTVHAIGDKANHLTLNAFEKLRTYEAEKGYDSAALRHRIEHVQCLLPADLTRLKKLDLIASVQPCHLLSDIDLAKDAWGERSAFAYAYGRLSDYETKLCFGSDAPVESPDPFASIHAAVNRKRPGMDEEAFYPENCLTRKQSLAAFTNGAAFSGYWEKEQGKLLPGYLADLIILNDFWGRDPLDLYQCKVEATMVNGNWVWSA